MIKLFLGQLLWLLAFLAAFAVMVIQLVQLFKVSDPVPYLVLNFSPLCFRLKVVGSASSTVNQTENQVMEKGVLLFNDFTLYSSYETKEFAPHNYCIQHIERQLDQFFFQRSE